MAKFGINDLIDIKKKESKAETVDEYKEIWLNPRDVKPSESNFYSQENIEELADSFGLDQVSFSAVAFLIALLFLHSILP